MPSPTVSHDPAAATGTPLDYGGPGSRSVSLGLGATDTTALDMTIYVTQTMHLDIVWRALR